MKTADFYDDVYIRLFFIVPLLFYTGYSIHNDKTHTSSVMFRGIVVLLIALTLFFHLRYLIKVVRRIFRNQVYQKDFGIFLLSLAVFITFLCFLEIYQKQEKRK